MPRYRTEATKSPPRLMIEVTEDQWSTLKKYLPYGFQKQIFKAIIEDMVRMWGEFGDDFTRAMLAKNLTYQQFMDDYLERTHGYIKRSKEAQLPRDELGGTISTYQGDTTEEEDEE